MLPTRYVGGPCLPAFGRLRGELATYIFGKLFQYRIAEWLADGNVTLGGSSGTSGAVVDNSVTVAGSGQYHYDTKLATTETTLGVTYRISAWSVTSLLPLSSFPAGRSG